MIRPPPPGYRPALVNTHDLVEAQLKCLEKAKVAFEDGSTTLLATGRCVDVNLSPDRHIRLDGTWACRRGRVLSDAARLADPSTDTAAWETVDQPGVVCIADPEIQPANIPGWDRRFMSHIAEDDGAVLRRSVIVPEAWAGQRILLRLDGVYPACDVYFNGTRVAEHRSGLTALCVDASSHAKPGEQLAIAVVIVRRYAGQEIDMPRHTSDYAGMHGSAWLFALPKCHVSEHAIQAELAPDHSTGWLRGPVCIRNDGPALRGEIELSLTAPDGREIARLARAIEVPGQGELRTGIEIPVTTPALWIGEAPRLHTVKLSWRIGADVQTLSWRVGFRRFAVIDGRPTINRHPLKLRGVNHLNIHPRHGIHTPVSWLRENLALMRKANVNAVRVHLTAPAALLDLCDELGLYVIQEVTIDWYGHELWLPRCLGPCLHRIESTIRRDRHHACLIAVGIGNENLPGGPDEIASFRRHYEIFQSLAKALAPDLWVMYPPPGPANKIPGDIEPRIGDIADVHYNFKSTREFRATGSVLLPESWQGPFKTYSREELLRGPWNGVWFSSEYGIVNAIPDIHDAPWQSVICEVAEDWLGSVGSAQALANRLEREWGLMRDDPTCLGGAYFPWLPPGRGDTWGWTFWAEDADWGVVTQDLTPKPQLWVLRAAYSPITFAERRLRWAAGQTEITVKVRNRYSTIDLSACTLRTQLGATGQFLGILCDWKDLSAACPPGEDATLTLPIWHQEALVSLREGRPVIYRLHVIAPDGFRPLTHDILVIPEQLAPGFQSGRLNLGSDA